MRDKLAISFGFGFVVGAVLIALLWRWDEGREEKQEKETTRTAYWLGMAKEKGLSPEDAAHFILSNSFRASEMEKGK